MQRTLLSLALVLTGIVVAGCPIYPDERGERVCRGGTCYSCSSGRDDDCVSWYCRAAGDCPSDYLCDVNHRCVALGGGSTPTPGTTPTCARPSDCTSDQNCGADNLCHSGDCATSGCPGGFICKLASGKPVCVPSTTGTDGGQPPCQTDAECAQTTAGSKCLSGTCAAPSEQCSDATQCKGSSLCVQGACIPACSASAPCPNGFSCDLAKGVCTGNPTPCATSEQCGGGLTCIEQHCVDTCGPGGTCSGDLVCVGGGCVPDERPRFSCTTEGEKAECQAGSVCLRHNCYIACEADAGAEACKTTDRFDQCKPVSAGAKTVHVCGSSTNLGDECDVAAGRSCASPLVCIDGFCR